MKKVAIILGIVVGTIILLIALAFFLGTSSSTETVSYFDADYYHKTLARLDSIKAKNVTQRKARVQAGFAKLSITPELSSTGDDYKQGKFHHVPLAGYGGREGKPATAIHDSIFVQAAALKIGDQTVIFVSSDLLIMPPNIVDSVTALLAKEKINREQVYYSATHTHSSLGAWGTGYVGELFAGKENSSLEKWLTLRISQVITSAVRDLRPARIASGTFPVGRFTSNRLIGESGTKNNDFSFITLEQTGHKKAVLGSYSAHATTLSADNWEISADYPGYWTRKMEGAGIDYAMFFAGSVGSQSPSGEGSGFEKAKYIGEALADSLSVHLQTITMSDTVSFSALALKMHLPEYNIRLTTNRELTSYISRKLLPFSDNTYLQAVRLGNMIWISTPSDFSGEYALQLKNSLAQYGYQANVTSFNGSYVGYIVPGRYFYLDEYEPKVMGWYGPNMGEYTIDLIRQLSRVMTEADNI